MSDLILVGATKSQERSVTTALEETDISVRVWNGGVEDAAGAEELTRSRPATIVLGSDLGDAMFDLAQAIEDLDPTVATIVITQSTNLILQKAMAAGVRGVLEPSARQSTIKTVLEQAVDAGRRLRGSHPELAAASSRRFITVVSAKGGAGKTVISSNLALRLAGASERDTVLVDLDLQFGDVATALLLTPTHSIIDAADAADESLDAAALKVFLTRHPPTDLYVLAAPDEPAAGEALSLEKTGVVLDTLAAEFREVVVDTDPGLSETTLVALERSTDIVIVADLDVPSVRGTRKLIEALDLIGMSAPARYLVLNRADSKVGLSPSEVEDAVGMKIDMALPSTRHVPVSVNEGQPMVLSAPRSTFARRITEFADSLAPTPAKVR